MATHIFTSLAANYLAKARVLAHSIKKFHPGFLFHVVLCDAVPDGFSLEKEPFDSLITLHDLGLRNPEQWIFKHTLVELSTAVKGLALEKLLATPGCEQVLYIDPDIIVLSPLDGLLAEFGRASILLTPHLAEPEATTEAILDNEISVLQHGIFNLGFVGVKNSAEGRKFAAWWAHRLEHFCYDDIPRGIFTDQRWADLIPAYFPDHKILRDPGYNVCTWNLTNRNVTGSLREGLFVNGEPITFYHFSGLDSGAQHDMLDKYGRSMPALYELRDWYIGECKRMGQSEVSNLRWAYGFFDNGERVLNIHRRHYREHADLQSAFPNPYSTGDLNHSYLYWYIRNSGSGVALANTSVLPDSISTRDYRVFVIAAREDAPFIDQTLEKVWERTALRQNIFFVANQCIVSSCKLPGSIQPLEVEGETYDDLFTAVLSRFQDRDALLIRAGAVPPDKWDLRLAWSTARQRGIATVSPIDERLLDKAGLFRSARDGLLDRLCYWYRLPSDVETASFCRECVYVCAEAARNTASVLDRAGKLRYSHLLATHICMAWRSPRAADQNAPPYLNESVAITQVRDRLRAHFHADTPTPPAVTKSLKAANLHILHSWGAGAEQWTRDYSRADQEHHNFVLKSFGPPGSFGTELRLYRGSEDPKPLEVWRLDPCIKATAPNHAGYTEILNHIFQQYGIQRIIISSLVGHSLDVLRQPLATVFVCHDYYPFCPAFNITFGELCRCCDESRLVACTCDNPHNRFFANVPPAEWMRIRKEFTAAVKDYAVTVIAPSRSVYENYSRLLPEITSSLRVIPHGAASTRSAPLQLEYSSEARLRVIILGSLAPHKGELLLECMVPELLTFCDLMLVGCGYFGKAYAENSKIVVIPEYERDSLPDLIAELKPNIGLLLSLVPETFSYTLGELQHLGVPVLATNIGSFVDRIEEGVTGFLCDPEPELVVQRLKELADDSQALQRIHENLKHVTHRTAEEMVRDYEELHPMPYSPGAYFSSKLPPSPQESSLQLYWRTRNSSFEEKNSFSATPFGRERQILRLYFAIPDERIEQVRFDPSKQKDFLLLYALSLRDIHDTVLWNWDGNLAALQSILCNQIFFFHPRVGDTPALFYLTGTDPYLILPIEADVLAKLTPGSYLEVEFRLTCAEEQMDVLLSAAELSQNFLQLTPSIKDLDLRKVAAQYREQRLEELRDRIQELQHRIEELQAGAEEARSRAEQAHARLQAEVRQRDSRVQQLEEQMVRVQNSISWRVTRPARTLAAFGRRVKRSLRGG